LRKLSLVKAFDGLATGYTLSASKDALERSGNRFRTVIAADFAAGDCPYAGRNISNVHGHHGQVAS
jgi:hypothetical protein